MRDLFILHQSDETEGFELIWRSIKWLIPRQIKVEARVSYHAEKLYVHVSTASSLAHHYPADVMPGVQHFSTSRKLPELDSDLYQG
jgi:hypothetical protein